MGHPYTKSTKTKFGQAFKVRGEKSCFLGVKGELILYGRLIVGPRIP